MDYINTVGDNIRHFRRIRDLTQENLAEETGLSVNFISSVERGTRNISVNNLITISTALDVNISQLVAQHNNNQINQFLPTLIDELNKLPIDTQDALIQNFIQITRIASNYDK